MSETLEVFQSRFSGKALSAFVRKSYGLKQETICTLFRAAMNDLYIVAEGERKFVFRFYTKGWRTRIEIEEELRLLKHLHENGAPVSYPIPNLEGNYVQRFDAPEGERFGVLFSYADGTKNARFTADASRAMGKALAEVHKLSENFKMDRIDYSSEALLVTPLARIKSFFDPTSEEVRFLESLSTALSARYAEVSENRVRSGAVHLDVWFDNLHVDANDKVTFFDFDFCGNAWLVHDISYFLFQLFTTHPNDNVYLDKAESFLEGYASVIPMSEEENNLLPYACLGVMIYYLSIQCDRFEYWTNIFLNRDHLRRFVGNLKRWMAYHGIDLSDGQQLVTG